MSDTKVDVLTHVTSHAIFAPIVDEYVVPDQERLNRELVEAIR